MEQKTKLTILIILLLIAIFGGVYWMLNKNNMPVAVAPTTAPTDQKLSGATNANANPGTVREISGKVRSINEKAFYIELADGKGFAANIKPTTPVSIQGVDKRGSLADLKAGQNVAVKVDGADNAVQILIQK